jgi:hypothetical protein
MSANNDPERRRMSGREESGILPAPCEASPVSLVSPPLHHKAQEPIQTSRFLPFGSTFQTKKDLHFICMAR